MTKTFSPHPTLDGIRLRGFPLRAASMGIALVAVAATVSFAGGGIAISLANHQSALEEPRDQAPKTAIPGPTAREGNSDAGQMAPRSKRKRYNANGRVFVPRHPYADTDPSAGSSNF
ncbi:hypothetical protein [Mycolicibacterium brumae]|nr:hypothetical protein [Mycolicibacterium brumae]MCV7192231.1 hypothetical protein [Mycolicibacterium brumae]UWW08177.1 hypothetical protein L2Z93_001220 [Mycolicibacterium brumae]